MGRGTLRDVQNRSGTIGKIRDGSGDPLGGPRRVERTSGRSGTGRGNLGEVRYGSGTLGKVLYGSWDPRRGRGRVGGPNRRSGTGWGTLGEARDGLEEPSGCFKTGRGTLGEV